MHKCAANPAPNGEKPSAEQQNEHGIEQPQSSGQEGLTLFESRVLTALNTLIEQNEMMIGIMLDEPEQGEEAQPFRYLNGQSVS